MRTRSLRAARMAGIALMCHLAACTSWQGRPATAPDVSRIPPTEEVRVVRNDGVTITLTDARVNGDSLVGRVRLQKGVTMTQPTATALTDIRELQVKKTDAGKTALAFLGLMGFSLLFGG